MLLRDFGGYQIGIHGDSTAVPARERVMLTYCVQERAVNSVVERLKRPWVFLVYAARR